MATGDDTNLLDRLDALLWLLIGRGGRKTETSEYETPSTRSRDLGEIEGGLGETFQQTE